MTQPGFWVVWNERGGSPTVKHNTFDSARKEAERLARVHAGQSFHVLQLCGSMVKTDVHWIDANVDDGIPF
jgi:hypothetical protein